MSNYLEYNNMVKQRKENGFYNLEADQMALKLFSQEITSKSIQFDTYMDKYDYLIDNKYYVNFNEMYERKQIEELANTVYAENFEFKSFMAASKFYQTYSLMTWDRRKYLETYADRVIATALFLAQGDVTFANRLALAMIRQEYQPATPTFLNSGRAKAGELVSCFLLELDDSLNSINYNLSTAMQLSKIGGGVALNLSKLRGRGEAIKGNKGVGRGVMPVMKLLEDAFNYVDQLGQRPGAGAVYLNIFHADVLEFLDTKKINADEKTRIQTLSLGLIVPDKFMELAKNNEEMCLFYPLTVFEQYGVHLDDMDLDEMYETLRDNPLVERKTISPRKMLQQIAITQFESGYPYLVYTDKANEANPLKNMGRIKMSNLCTEIFQVQTTSQINDYGVDDVIGYDVSCNLGSLNIANVMNSGDFAGTIKTAMEALTAVSDLSNVENAPGVQKANNDFHAVGLGAMNLHGYLSDQRIGYESGVAKEFAACFFATVNYYSIKASMEIAKEKGETFKGFEGSEYATGEYFKMYEDNDFTVQDQKLKVMFENVELPSKEMWTKLKADVAKYGMYHAYRMAIAPTQSISYIQNATASIQPIVDQIETRMYGNSLTYYPMPFLREDNVFFYKSAYNMDQKKLIDLVSVIQPHVDQGISTVLYVTNQASTKDLASLYYYAWAKGLKSLYYIRTKNLTIAECETCAV